MLLACLVSQNDFGLLKNMCTCFKTIRYKYLKCLKLFIVLRPAMGRFEPSKNCNFTEGGTEEEFRGAFIIRSSFRIGSHWKHEVMK